MSSDPVHPAPPERVAEPAPPVVRRRTVVLVTASFVSLLLALLAAGAIPKVLTRRELAADARRVRDTPPQLYVDRPRAASEAPLSLAGTTQAFADSVIYARTSGYVSKRYVDIGDRVKAGQLLAEIESPEVDRQLVQARADLQQSQKNLDLQKANLELAGVSVERYQAADKEGAVAKETVDQQVAALKTARAAVAAAQANVDSNQANVERNEQLTSFERVVAPFAGVVTQRNVDVGALITAGSPTNNTSVAPTTVTGGANGLFEVAQTDTLRVFINVPQVYAPNVKTGMKARVRPRGQLDNPVEATVTRTANALDPGSRTLLAEVDVPNAAGRLLPGMFVYVDLNIAPGGSRFRVPATAVVFDARGTQVVTVAAGNKLHFQPVVLGRDFGDAIDVQAGLTGDEMVVRQPTVTQQEGQLVTPREEQVAAK
jgi:RND family efflux transporter MFP subunit